MANSTISSSSSVEQQGEAVQGGEAVATGRVANRRKLRFHSLDDILEEAERLAASELVLLGNWTLAQIFEHLAIAMDASIDGMPFSAPWHIRLMGPLLRRRILKKGMPAGYRLPEDAQRLVTVGPTADTQTALHHLYDAVARLRCEDTRTPHPIFGRMTLRQWDELCLRHAEMHLSFVKPKEK